MRNWFLTLLHRHTHKLFCMHIFEKRRTTRKAACHATLLNGKSLDNWYTQYSVYRVYKHTHTHLSRSTYIDNLFCVPMFLSQTSYSFFSFLISYKSLFLRTHVEKEIMLTLLFSLCVLCAGFFFAINKYKEIFQCTHTQKKQIRRYKSTWSNTFTLCVGVHVVHKKNHLQHYQKRKPIKAKNLSIPIDFL